MTATTRCAAAVLAVAMAASGCGGVVGGTAQPAAGLAPRPVTGAAIEQVLPDREQLAQLLDQPLIDDAEFPPQFGGINDMPNGIFASPRNTPRECGGVVASLQANTYRGSTVQNFADHSWKEDRTRPVKVAVVGAGVVALAASADADALFAKFTQQWTQCDGKTMTTYDSDGALLSTRKITAVWLADSVLAATFQATLSSGYTTLSTHAIGVRVNCLVEVKVGFEDEYRSPSRAGTGDPRSSAVQIAHAMMDNVSEHSH